MSERQELIKEAMISIRSQLTRAYKNKLQVSVSLSIMHTGKYTITGLIKSINKYTVTIECDTEDGIMTETFYINTIKMISVYD